MNTQFAVSVVVVVVLLGVFGYVVHGMLLTADYNKLKGYRPKEEASRYYPLMLPAHIIAAIAFVWLFRRTMDTDPPLVQGIQFGAAIAALMIVHKFVIYYTIQQIPGSLAVRQIVFDTIGMLVMAVIIAFLNSGPSLAG